MVAAIARSAWMYRIFGAIPASLVVIDRIAQWMEVPEAVGSSVETAVELWDDTNEKKESVKNWIA